MLRVGRGEHMTILELKFLLLNRFNGFYWCFFEVDIPEWTRPQYYHQN